jgi:hypothetical protein
MAADDEPPTCLFVGGGIPLQVAASAASDACSKSLSSADRRDFPIAGHGHGRCRLLASLTEQFVLGSKSREALLDAVQQTSRFKIGGSHSLWSRAAEHDGHSQGKMLILVGQRLQAALSSDSSVP